MTTYNPSTESKNPRKHYVWDRDQRFWQTHAKDVKTSFDTSGYSMHDNRPPPITKIKTVISMWRKIIKDERDGKIIAEFLALKAKMCA